MALGVTDACAHFAYAAPALLEGLIGCSPALPANTRAAALGSVRMIALGAGPATSKLLEEAFATFPRARIVTAYGMTEACSTIALREAARSYAAGGAGGLGEEAWRHVESCAEGRRGGGLSVESGMCVGRPAPHAEVAILRADGQLAGPGHEGEVLTRGTHIMTGYWNDVNVSLPPKPQCCESRALCGIFSRIFLFEVCPLGPLQWAATVRERVAAVDGDE
jgi:acyl-CoA synthetase (AMP-forming)/AMP-acid ligase II